MKVYLGAVRETDQVGILESHAAFSKSHKIVTDPSAADVILILGARHSNRKRLLEYELYKAFPSAAPFIPKTTIACLSFQAFIPMLRSVSIPGSAASSTTRTSHATDNVRIVSWKRLHRPFPSE